MVTDEEQNQGYIDPTQVPVITPDDIVTDAVLSHGEVLDQSQIMTSIAQGFVNNPQLISENHVTPEDILRNANVVDEKGEIIEGSHEILEEVRQIVNGGSLPTQSNDVLMANNLDQQFTSAISSNQSFQQQTNLITTSNQLPDIQSTLSTTSLPIQMPIMAQSVNSSFNPIKSSSVIQPRNSLPQVLKSSDYNFLKHNVSTPKVIKSSTIVPKIETSQAPVSIKINTQKDQTLDEMNKGNEKGVFKISTVTGKEMKNSNIPYKCSTCGLNLVSEAALKSHKKTCITSSYSSKEKKSIYNNFTCPFCNKKYDSRVNLVSHIKSCNKSRSQSSPITKQRSFNNKTYNTPKTSKDSSQKNKLSISNDSLIYNNSRKLGSMKSQYSNVKGKSFFGDIGGNNTKAVNKRDEDVILDVEDSDDDIFEDDDFEFEKPRKKSQKHLGPLIVQGKYKCRDCHRTFSKEQQYNRHIGACSNVPLDTSRIDGYSPPPTFEDSVDKKSKIKEYRDELKKSKDFNQKKHLEKKSSFSDDFEIDDPDLWEPDEEDEFLAKLKRSKSQTRSRNRGGSDYLNDVNSQKKASYNQMNSLDNKLLIKNLNKYKSDIMNGSEKKSMDSDSFLNAYSNRDNSEFNTRQRNMNNFTCGLCNDNCRTDNEFKLHVQTCHCQDVFFVQSILNGRDSNASHKCPICELNYFTIDSLLLHMTVIHKKQLEEVYRTSMSRDVKFPCPWCPSISRSKSLLEEHLATKHIDQMVDPSVASDDEKELLKDGRTSYDSNSSRRSACIKCGMLIAKVDLEMHQEICKNIQKAFHCHFKGCENQKYDRLLHLMNHLEKVHDKEFTSEIREFDENIDFMEWLQTEEKKHNVKFFKAYQRMKNNHLCSAWLCQNFNSATKFGSNFGMNKLDSSSDEYQCFSRIMVEVHLNKRSAR